MKNTLIKHLLILCSLGVGIGLAGFILFPWIPLLSDSISYFTVARNLLMGKGLVSSFVSPNEAFIMGLPCPDIHMPAWPLLIASFMLITRSGPYAPVLLNILLAISSSLIFYFTVRAWSDSRTALIGSIFFLLLPLVLAYEFTGLAEISLTFWSLLAVFLASVARPKSALAWLLLIVLAYLFAFATRQTSVFMVPLVSLILLEREFSRSQAIWFGIALVLLSAVANLAYSGLDSLSEAQALLFRYDLLLHTGFLKKGFYRDILMPADLNPGVPIPQLLLAVLVKKPVRMFASYLGPDNIWCAENLMKILAIAILVGGPFLVRNRRIRWGLLAFLLAFFMAVWFYKFEARQFVALSAVSLCLVFGLAGGSRVRPWFTGLILLVWAGLGVIYTLEVQRGRLAVYQTERVVAPALARLLPPSARVAAGYPSTLVLYRPDISVVTTPGSFDDLTLLRDRPGLDAIVLAVSEPAIVSWGWSEQVFVLGTDTFFVYRKP